MGIVYSTFAPTAVRLAYICQKLFDPKYSRIEDVQPAASNTDVVSASAADSQQQQVQLLSKVEPQHTTHESALYSLPASRMLTVKSNSLPRYNSTRSPEYNYNSVHQQNRSRRARQLRFKTRPSSFDGALIIRTKTKNAVIVTSTPSPLSRHWDVTSSSGCSSDSNSDSESDESETELRVSQSASNEEIGSSAPKLGMTAEEEEAFRLTLGRGHFTRSKKDHFLNNLRLQKHALHRQMHRHSEDALW